MRILTCKVRDKWNQLVFVPMPVLNNRDLTSGGKAGKREGFNTFNRFVTFQMMRRCEIDKKILKAVLQTVWEVFPEGLWLVVPPLLLVPWSTVGSAPILQVLDPSLLSILPTANLHKEQKPHGGVEEEQQGDKSGKQLPRGR